jgi:hypothetical protein
MELRIFLFFVGLSTLSQAHMTSPLNEYDDEPAVVYKKNVSFLVLKAVESANRIDLKF